MNRFNFDGKNFENVKYMIQHSDNELILEDVELGSYYLDLIKARHNILHFAVLDYIGLEWTSEKTVRSFLKIKNINPILDKTPDIQLFLDKYYMIDVSMSRDIHLNELRKSEKYGLVVQFLKNINIESEFIHINCNLTWSNLFKELEKIKFLQKNEFKLHDFSTCLKLIEDKINIIRDNISLKYFEELKLSQFSDSIETMGYSEDIEIDIDAFIEFNGKFEIESDILKSYEEQISEKELCEILKPILENEENVEIYDKYKDLKCDSSAFKDAELKILEINENMEKTEPKPSHHIVFPFYESFNVSSTEKKEQDQILDFFKYLKKNKNDLNDEYVSFVQEIGDNLCKMFDDKNPNKKYNVNVFYDFFKNENEETFMKIFKKMNKMNILLNTPYKFLDSSTKKFFRIESSNYSEIFEHVKLEYEEMKQKYTYRKGNFSYKDFLIENDVIENEKEWFDTYAFKNKCFLTNLESKSIIFKKLYKKTGISHKFVKEDFKKNFEQTIDISYSVDVDSFLKLLTEKSHYPGPNKYSEYLKEISMLEDEYSKKIKIDLTDNFISKFEYISGTNSFEYLYKIKLISTQLMHFTMLEMKPGSFSIFTCGIPNFVCIVAGCYNKLFSQLGKPFMCCFITENPNIYTNFFGKLSKTKLKDGRFLVITNWRRLPSFKLLHIKDLFYSIISSTMNSLLSFSTEFAPLKDLRIRKQFSLRTMIGCCTNQKPSEFLVDVRYAYISSYARYTNIGKLLLEKFKPPYRTSIECWIVRRLFTRLPIIHENTSNIKLTAAHYFQNKRTLSSMNVDFNMPSLWFDYNLMEINEFLDEAFCYVHTLKEPSNIYYENVKAINTIMKFQMMYDELDEHRKKGIYKTKQEILDFLKSDNQIGCFSRCIIQSATLMYNTDDPFFSKIIHQINDEDIGELISTKAVISDNERKIKPVKEFSKRQIFKRIFKRDFYKSDLKDEELEIKYVMESKSPYYNDRKPRQKVFETTLNILEKYPEIEKTKDLANFFITKEKGIVNADICIKAQYGSKREFYVINIGAKALARCTENFFKKICETNIHEAISIPGDFKMEQMQKMIDRAYITDRLKPTSKLIYVNGDCTKWSAAETMASFISLIIPLKNRIPEGMYNILLSTYNSWSKKNIQIPLDIINNFILPGNVSNDQDLKKYNAIRKSILENNGKFKSTQNFLQGMYNYASSYKAVCCSNYTYHIWKKIYPQSTLYIEHMEHSDDYVLVVMTEDFKEFEKFRVLHKIMMKFHGFNDSDKKTNCQLFMMEFVSLISFNGVMLYPQIKKTKEVNTNLPCVGYKSDIEASYSRVGEAMRMGCNQTFLYFMGKWQNICIAEAYSILPGMRNSYSTTLKEMLDTPVELFGLIDMLPLFSLYCKGNGNNYRLFKYGDDKTKNIIKFLFLKAQETQLKENVLVENAEYMYSLFNPKFIYERSNSSIVKLRRKLNWFPEDLIKFWENHSSYRFMKPRNRINLVQWLKSMFYNRTFTEAYSKSSRTKMTLRISHFIRNPIIALRIDKEKFKEKYPEKNSTLMTIKEYIEYMKIEFNSTALSWDEKKNESIIRIITKCDPTFGAIYEYIRNTKIVNILPGKASNRPQISIRTPDKITSVDIVNNASNIIQYIYNNEDFMTDKRRIVSELSMLKDVELVKENFLNNIKENVKTMELLSLFNNLSILKEKNIVCIGFSRHSETLKEQIRDIFQFNFLPFTTCEVVISDFIKINDPVTGRLLYTRGGKMTLNIIQQSLENVALIHSYMSLKENKRRDQMLEVLNKMIFKDPLHNDELSFKELIHTVTEKNLKTFNLNLQTVKLLGYFKSYYYGQNDILNTLVSNYYSYTYKYTDRAKRYKNENKWFGETFGVFKHMENIVAFNNLNAPENSNIVLLTDNVNTKLLTLHYNIALRLVSLRTESDFQRNPTKIKIEPRKLFKTREEALGYFDTHNVRGLYQKSSDKKIKYINSLNYDENETYLPIFKINDVYDVGNLNKGTLRPSYLRIDNTKLMVFLGDTKLYTMPVLACHQFKNVKYLGTEKLYKEMLKQDNLYNYFHLKRLNIYKRELFKLSKKKILNEMKQKKLYDFFTDDLLNYLECQNKSLVDVLKAKSGVVNYLMEQGLLIEKQNPDIVQVKKSKDLGELNIFDEDFLIPNEEIGIDLDDTFDLIDMPVTHDFDFINFYGLGGDFLIKPNSSTKTVRQNYILAKLKNLPSFELTFNRNIILKTVEEKTMNLYELIDNIKMCVKTIQKEKGDAFILYDLYELLCNTYIKTHARKTVHQYHLKGKKIIFSTTFSVPNTDLLRKSLNKKSKVSKNIKNIKLLEDKILFDVVFNVKNAMEKFNETMTVKTKLFRKMEYLHNFEEMTEQTGLNFLDLI